MDGKIICRTTGRGPPVFKLVDTQTPRTEYGKSFFRSVFPVSIWPSVLPTGHTCTYWHILTRIPEIPSLSLSSLPHEANYMQRERREKKNKIEAVQMHLHPTEAVDSAAFVMICSLNGTRARQPPCRFHRLLVISSRLLSFTNISFLLGFVRDEVFHLSISWIYA